MLRWVRVGQLSFRQLVVAEGYTPHDTVGALTQLLCDIVPRIDNEFLAKDLEASASADVGHVCEDRDC